jgi:hypothetical protein
MILIEPRVRRDDFSARTGWRFEPEGACRGDLCVPLPEPPGEWLDAATLSERLGMPLVSAEAAGVWCLGPESMGRVLQTAEAPDLRLPDWKGEPFALSSLRGSKVLLLAWASW